MDSLFTREEPTVPKRGIHLDLKGLPPTPERLLSLLDLFAAIRYNFILLEWEDSFPWTVDERLRSKTPYTKDEVTRFVKKASELNIELIPLVQCLGHMENPLSLSGNENLQEEEDNQACLNPLAPGARELVQNMVDDVLKLMPEVKHFHLGGDEAWAFGNHPETKKYIEKHGKGALYLQHIEPILDNLNNRKIRPILWHDMMIDWQDDAQKALAEKCDLMPWMYEGHPNTTNGHCKTEYIQRFSDNGFKLWGASAYKGAEGYDADIPDIPLHSENAKAWTEISQRFNMEGVVATAWSRYAVDTIQCNPIDSSLDSMVMVAVILHDGTPPSNGLYDCIQALDEIGEKERFESCRKVMEELSAIRKKGWDNLQHARQVAVLGKIDPDRISAMNTKLGLKSLLLMERNVKQADELEKEFYATFEGLIDPVWIKEYFDTRIEPLREELALLKEHVAKIEK